MARLKDKMKLVITTSYLIVAATLCGCSEGKRVLLVSDLSQDIEVSRVGTALLCPAYGHITFLVRPGDNENIDFQVMTKTGQIVGTLNLNHDTLQRGYVKEIDASVIHISIGSRNGFSAVKRR